MLKKVIMAIILFSSFSIFADKTEVGRFKKADYKAYKHNFEIGHLTQSQSFSKIIIDTIQNEKFTPIINTIKVYQSGKWVPYKQSKRLTVGMNEFNISIPQGTQKFVITFDHGKNADVIIYIE